MHGIRRPAHRTARLWTATAVAVLASLLSASVPASAAPPPGAKLWKAFYTSPGPYQWDDVGSAVVAHPSGATVFVTGSASAGPPQMENFATVAYDAATGAPRWTARYDSGLGSRHDRPADIAISPDGGSVFVAGEAGATLGTVAYNAATGAKRWEAHYPGIGAVAVVVSPDGTRVFVTGTTTGASATLDYATVAYDAATGAELWVRTYNGPDAKDDTVFAMGISPDGSKVVVTGWNKTNQRGQEYLTIAYHSTTGTTAWFKRFNAGPGQLDDQPTALAVAPTGTYVVVTGQSFLDADLWRYQTVSYDLATGTERWVARHTDPAFTASYAADVVVTPDATAVFVTGAAARDPEAGDYAYSSVGYDAATGAALWDSTYDGPGGYYTFDLPVAAAVSDDGTSVVVTGSSSGTDWLGIYDFATVAYDTATGAQEWVSRLNRAVGSHDEAADLAVVPGAGRVVVTGWSLAYSNPSKDFATVAIAL